MKCGLACEFQKNTKSVILKGVKNKVNLAYEVIVITYYNNKELY